MILEWKRRTNSQGLKELKNDRMTEEKFLSLYEEQYFPGQLKERKAFNALLIKEIPKLFKHGKNYRMKEKYVKRAIH